MRYTPGKATATGALALGVKLLGYIVQAQAAQTVRCGAALLVEIAQGVEFLEYGGKIGSSSSRWPAGEGRA